MSLERFAGIVIIVGVVLHVIVMLVRPRLYKDYTGLSNGDVWHTADYGDHLAADCT